MHSNDRPLRPHAASAAVRSPILGVVIGRPSLNGALRAWWAWALAAAALAGFALLAAGCAGSVPKGLSEVRVCTAEAFDRKGAECRRDESGEPLVSARFYCSARVGGRKGERFSARFLYEGQPMPLRSTTVPAGSVTMWTDVSFGGATLPGGRWGCRFAVAGDTDGEAFASGGPTGPIVDVAACLKEGTAAAGRARVCRADRSSAPFPRRGEITCSAIYAGGKNTMARVELVYRGRETGIAVEQRLPLPVAAVGAHFSRAGGLPAGPYACRFLLAGEPVAEKSFSVAG